jgi:hypothetical protein
VIASSAGSSSGTRQPTRWKSINVEQALKQWRESDWRATVDGLRVELTEPDDIAVAAAQEILPGYPWPAYSQMPSDNVWVWRKVKEDVWSHLGIAEPPFPPG